MLSPVSDPETISTEDEKAVLNFRQKLSPSQKRRSKLQQAPEEPVDLPATPPPSPTPEPPPVDAAVPLLRKMRLKRSGHMHEDLAKTIAEDGDTPGPTHEY